MAIWCRGRPDQPIEAGLKGSRPCAERQSLNGGANTLKGTQGAEQKGRRRLTVAYDASMDDRKAFLSVGGFVSPVADWTDFDGEWRDRLSQEGLSYFRMADLAHSVGDFEPLGKQKERRRGLLADLLGIISCHAYRKFGVTVDVETVDAEFSDQNKLEYAGYTVVRLVEASFRSSFRRELRLP